MLIYRPVVYDYHCSLESTQNNQSPSGPLEQFRGSDHDLFKSNVCEVCWWRCLCCELNYILFALVLPV